MTNTQPQVDQLKQIAEKPLDPEEFLLHAVIFVNGILQGLDEARISNLRPGQLRQLEPLIGRASKRLQVTMGMYLESRT